MTVNKNILDQAIKNPSEVYRKPEDVISDIHTTYKEKIKILDSWELDQNRLLESESENMPEDHETEKAAIMLQEISKTKNKLMHPEKNI
tara:strand:- start:3220 stop:3486 length:267 start_codon:yes stop_codon:yes gene_type:complete